MNNMLIQILAFLIIGCGQPSQVDETNKVKNDIEVNENAMQNKPDESMDCETSQNVDNYLDEIISNPSKFVNGNIDDNCVHSLLDSLSSKSIRLNNDRYLKALGAICRISDGYVGEALSTIAVKQYYHNLEGLLSFIDEDDCFKKMVIWGLSMEVSVGDDKTMSKIKDHAAKTKLSPNERELVDKVLTEIDPEIFD